MNMNYCKFENTFLAMRQINQNDAASSESEENYKNMLLQECIEFLESNGFECFNMESE